MKFYEGKSQFIILDENEDAPEGVFVHKLIYTGDSFTSTSFQKPEYELEIISHGGRYFTPYWNFYYKGVCFKPKIDGVWERGVINILNQIKASQNRKKTITEIIKNSMTDQEFKIISPVIDSRNILAEDLKTKIKDFENYIEELKKENEKLKEKTDKIQLILNS